MAGVAALLAAAFVAPRFIAPPGLDENRVLAEAPLPPRDLKSLQAFPKDADLYVSDHFPPRAQLIGALNYLRLKLGVSGSKRVVVGRDGWLFYDTGSHMGAVRGEPKLSDPDARTWLGELAARTEALRAQGVAYLVVVAPDKEAVYPQHGPAWFRPDPDRTAVRLARLAAQSGAGEVVYPGPAMAQAARAGVRAYSPYETHWTGLGAYEGYAALLRRLQARGLTGAPRPLESFAYIRHKRLDTPRNLALMLGIADFVPIEHPDIQDPEAEGRLTTTFLTQRYDWTSPRVVDTGQVGKPVLLMTMDSFSNALLPFLYGDFSRIILAHNQDGAWRPELIARFKPDVVLLEVVESGLPFVMHAGPEPSADAKARIEAALAHPAPATAGEPWIPPRRGPRAPQAPAETPPEAPSPAVERRRPLLPVIGHVIKVIDGGGGDDVLIGSAGDDMISGRAGADTIRGLAGDDVIRGGKGNDRIDGGDGDDELWGNKGDDTLTGGRGADSFAAGAGADLDLVTDFTPGQGDRVVLEPGTEYRVRQAGPDTIIDMRGSRMVLKGVIAAALPRGWLVVRGQP